MYSGPLYSDVCNSQHSFVVILQTDEFYGNVKVCHINQMKLTIEYRYHTCEKSMDIMQTNI